jgi:hypothetical protein
MYTGGRAAACTAVFGHSDTKGCGTKGGIFDRVLSGHPDTKIFDCVVLGHFDTKIFDCVVWDPLIQKCLIM